MENSPEASCKADGWADLQLIGIVWHARYTYYYWQQRWRPVPVPVPALGCVKSKVESSRGGAGLCKRHCRCLPRGAPWKWQCQLMRHTAHSRSRCTAHIIPSLGRRKGKQISVGIRLRAQQDTDPHSHLDPQPQPQPQPARKWASSSSHASCKPSSESAKICS